MIFGLYNTDSIHIWITPNRVLLFVIHVGTPLPLVPTWAGLFFFFFYTCVFILCMFVDLKPIFLDIALFGIVILILIVWGLETHFFKYFP